MSGSDLTECLDSDLVKKSKEDDIAAFEQLFDRYQKRVYNLIYRMVGNEQDAADLTQELFVRIYSSLHTLKTEEAFLSWMRAAAVNLCHDHFRKMQRTIRADSLDMKIQLDKGEVGREVEDWSANPERMLEKKDLQETVNQAIGSLSHDHRMVVVLHHIEGIDVKDIAKLLKVPVGTVKSRLARAREELRRKLGHCVG